MKCKATVACPPRTPPGRAWCLPEGLSRDSAPSLLRLADGTENVADRPHQLAEPGVRESADGTRVELEAPHGDRELRLGDARAFHTGLAGGEGDVVWQPRALRQPGRGQGNRQDEGAPVERGPRDDDSRPSPDHRHRRPVDVTGRGRHVRRGWPGPTRAARAGLSQGCRTGRTPRCAPTRLRTGARRSHGPPSAPGARAATP